MFDKLLASGMSSTLLVAAKSFREKEVLHINDDKGGFSRVNLDGLS